MNAARFHHQRGLGLVEALIAFLVLSLGMLAVVRLQPALRQHAEIARQRAEAVRLAQEDIEHLRSAAAPAAGIVPAAFDIDEAAASTRYHLQREVDATAWPNLRTVTVSVRWPARDGELQQVRLATLIGTADPAIAALSLLPR